MTVRIEPPTAHELSQLAKHMTRQQMADHMGVHIVTIRRWLRMHKLTYQKFAQGKVSADAAQLQALADAGLSIAGIGERLGVYRDTAARLLAEAGICTVYQIQQRGVVKAEKAIVNVTPSARALSYANPFGLGHASFLNAANR